MSVHKKTVSRIGALLLALVMMLSLLPTSVLATGSEPTVVIAGSDFQNPIGGRIQSRGLQIQCNITVCHFLLVPSFFFLPLYSVL